MFKRRQGGKKENETLERQSSKKERTKRDQKLQKNKRTDTGIEEKREEKKVK